MDPNTALWLSLVLNGGFLLVEAGVGWWSGSLALLSDAAHMLSDVGALVLALVAARLAVRKAGVQTTFGLRRSEVLGAFVNGLLLALATVWIVAEAIGRMSTEVGEVPGLPVLVVGLVGLGINLGSAWMLWRSASDNLNIRGALAHMLADALGSVGAVFAAGFLMAGYPLADPLISLLIAVIIGWGAWGVLRESARVLLQASPEHHDVAAVRATLLALDGVSGIHDLHMWSLDGQDGLLSAHLVVPVGTDLNTVRLAAETALKANHRLHHVTLQVEPDDEECAQQDCGAADAAK